MSFLKYWMKSYRMKKVPEKELSLVCQLERIQITTAKKSPIEKLRRAENLHRWRNGTRDRLVHSCSFQGNVEIGVPSRVHRLHQCIQCNFQGNVEIGTSPFKGQKEQIAASLLAAQFSEELEIQIKIRKSTLNFQGNVEIENTEDKNLEIYT